MITEAQRRALFALREALRLCERADIVIYTRGYQPEEETLIQVRDPQFLYPDLISVAHAQAVLDAHPEPTERFIGKATPETASCNRLSWRFRTVQGRILRWSGESTAAWWASEDKPQTVPGYRLDWATCDVFEVPN